MADNPALRAAHRRAVDTGRRAAEAAGVRPTQVTVVVETYSGPVGVSGSTLTGTTSTVLSPRPRVMDAAEANSYFGGGTGVASGGALIAGQYAIGPITLAYDGGGYTQEQIAPASSASKRVYYLLEGDEFSAGGEKFRQVGISAIRAHQINVIVERTTQ